MAVAFLDFEQPIAELEAIVRKLEEGDLPLEKSLEWIQLRTCRPSP